MPKILDKDKEEVALTKKTIKHVASGMTLKDAQKKTGQIQERFRRIVNRYSHIEKLYLEAKEKTGRVKERRTDDEKKEKAEQIFKLMAGNKSMREACIAVGVSRTTMLTWIRAPGNEYYSDRYDKAKDDLVEARIDEMFAIADEEPPKIVTVDAAGVSTERIDPAAAQYRRLRYDARKWYASKIAPKLYGDKTILAGDEDNPIQAEVTQITRRIVRPGDVPGSSD